MDQFYYHSLLEYFKWDIHKAHPFHLFNGSVEPFYMGHMFISGRYVCFIIKSYIGVITCAPHQEYKSVHGIYLILGRLTTLKLHTE